MYIFYRSYEYKNKTKLYTTTSIYTHQVSVYEYNYKLFETLVEKFGTKSVSHTKNSNKIYIRKLARLTRVMRETDSGDIIYNFSENYILKLSVGNSPGV